MPEISKINLSGKSYDITPVKVISDGTTHVGTAPNEYIFLPRFDWDPDTSVTQYAPSITEKLLKVLCELYPNKSFITFKGMVHKSGCYNYEILIYNTNDLVDGLPRYSSGLLRKGFMDADTATTLWSFGTYSGMFHISAMNGYRIEHGVATVGGSGTNQTSIDSSGNVYYYQGTVNFATPFTTPPTVILTALDCGSGVYGAELDTNVANGVSTTQFGYTVYGRSTWTSTKLHWVAIGN